MSDTGINVTPELYRAEALKLADLYETIASASGNKTSGQRAIANRLVEQYKAEIDTLFLQIENVLSNELDGGMESLAGVYTGVSKRLAKTFDEKVDEFLKAEAEKNKASETPVADLDVEALINEYKLGAKSLGLLRSVLEMFGKGDQIADIEPPKKMTGARGPRGPRALSAVQFIVNGTVLSAADNSVTKVAKSLGFDDTVDSVTDKDNVTTEVKNTAGKKFREFLVKNDIDLKDIPAVFGPFTGPNGSTLAGQKIAASADDDDDSDEDDSE